MDRFDAMRAFMQVVDSGSYTRAAQQLNLHKATVSQQIQQLEDKLGTRLLTRTTRSVTPTAEGLAYYQHARTILDQVDEVEAMLRKGTSAPAGHLRVNVPVAMGRLVFAPEMRGFLERHPRLTIELGCSDRAVDLVQEGVDCALRGGVLPDSQLSARRVGDLRFVLCAAPHYIDNHGLPATPGDLVDHQQVGYVLASTGKLRPVRLQREGQVAEHDVRARFVTTDSAAALSAGLDGLGLVVLAEFVASHHLTSGALVRVLPGWQCPSLPLHLVTPTARKRAARIQAFMDWAHALLLRRLGPHLETR
ncbi:MAG: LysR family transcriptional regulator [Steroidobacteraceae bacterium]|jgi:LysR family transcriptional regulator for bpeEF and oprC|nr:LysR family transcriptional regulator [Pseudomonadota bacterium]MBP7608696.1 LysR family transcriptional regulator [Steroidobacteraceae bacterium]MBP9130109.1 LysR family transcriptional regulator [Steroidobacteraceae bacterium]